MSRIRTLLFVFFIVFVQEVTGQEHIVQGVSPDLYLIHKVAARETWFNMSRTYNVSTREIAAYNQKDINTPLEIGQSVKIPLTQSNFTQSDVKGTGEVFVPVYHVVQEKEWMYRISVNHNKVPIEKLEKWNEINRDEVKAGLKLIVGFLKVKDANAPSVAKKTTTHSSTAVTQQAPAKKETAKPVDETKKTEAVVTSARPVNTSAREGGYFKSQYDENGKNYSGISGIFKSSSGWSDGKYYALMNNVTIGTIVKVKYPQTNKTIYAKVLGELPDMKESAGLALRISDSAASELGAVNNKFSVDVQY